MATGTVKRLVIEKGFGFIRDDVVAPQTTEYFFHRSDCQEFDDLREGQRVTFDPGTGPKGPRASRVATV